ncbi:aspartyl protease family protein [Canna indica]|uniref:Aspartyl protease family protein n=1 Tax=Canna indica TaxID=4628 RepID=A0AAQ3QNN3_9LILI|nr:aspartyl protease family protein [Canna indica]
MAGAAACSHTMDCRLQPSGRRQLDERQQEAAQWQARHRVVRFRVTERERVTSELRVEGERSKNLACVIKWLEIMMHHPKRMACPILFSSCVNGSNHTFLPLAHKHGPCSPFETKKPLSLEEALLRDQIRVKFIRGRSGSSSSTKSQFYDSKASVSTRYSAGEYVITVGFGTPRQEQTVTMDTGSDLSWIQCRPCSVCYSQQDPIFDPSQSSSYAAMPCSSSDCNRPRSSCASSCAYGITYGDGSTTSGVYSYETLTLSPSDVIRNFIFGCGVDNEGLFQDNAGIVGLGRGRRSLVSQTVRLYGGVFSYCLPPPSATGYLKLGGADAAPNAVYTRLLTSSNKPSFYFVDLVGISVAGEQLDISPSVFASRGTVLDSGTVITRLPAAAYQALRSAFRSYMAEYPPSPPIAILDTCYDFSGYKTVTVPRVALHFGGGVAVDLDVSGIFTHGCLAFAGFEGNGFGIIGNVQQRTFEVVYDVGNGRIGFAPRACG